ncbi:MAG: hypothetical protein IJT41_12375 [Clostridia bacterium]|nr:hypothetical protein [Clostridia bacterium]
MVYKIVYKVVAVLLALCVIPIAIFTPMVQVVGSVSIRDTLIGEHVSLYDIYQLFLGKHAIYHAQESLEMTEEVRSTMPWLITSGVFLGVALLLGIAAAVTAICCKSKLPTLIVSIAAGMSVFGLFRAFRAFAAPYLDGTITLAKMGVLGKNFLSSIASAIVKLEILQISSAGFLMFGAFIALFLWTGAFMLVEIGEDKK